MVESSVDHLVSLRAVVALLAVLAPIVGEIVGFVGVAVVVVLGASVGTVEVVAED